LDRGHRDHPDTGGFGFVFNNDEDQSGIIMIDADGTLATSFDGDGRWEADFKLRRAALQGDGKLVIAGTEKVNVHRRRAVVRRLNADGTPDATFGGGDGVVDLGFASNVPDLVLDGDDRITVIAGVFLNSSIAPDALRLVRLMPDGTFDGSFGGGDGLIDIPSGAATAAELAVGSDGSTYVDHDGGLVERYDERGALLWRRTDAPLGQMVIDGDDHLLFVRREINRPVFGHTFVTRLFPDRETDRAYRSSGAAPLTAVPDFGAAVAQGDELVVLGNPLFLSDGPPIVARLSGGPGLHAYVSGRGTLVVRADEGADVNDVIEIDRRDRDGRIVVRSKGGPDGIDWVGSFAPSRVKRIDVRTFGGDDSVVIGAGVKGAHVEAGAGDDSITGGDGGDLLFGGDGSDNLLGGAGDDRIFGNAGEDFLFGGDGADTSDNDPLDTRNDIEELL
jgi:uncharacterized delta-60 repeat protein